VNTAPGAYPWNRAQGRLVLPVFFNLAKWLAKGLTLLVGIIGAKKIKNGL
jgi:hypothetical protein